MPITDLGCDLATLDFHGIRRAATALLVGSALAIGLPVVLVVISPVQTIAGEIAGRTNRAYSTCP